MAQQRGRNREPAVVVQRSRTTPRTGWWHNEEAEIVSQRLWFKDLERHHVLSDGITKRPKSWASGCGSKIQNDTTYSLMAQRRGRNREPAVAVQISRTMPRTVWWHNEEAEIVSQGLWFKDLERRHVHTGGTMKRPKSWASGCGSKI